MILRPALEWHRHLCLWGRRASRLPRDEFAVVARAVVDLQSSDAITAEHVSEAIHTEPSIARITLLSCREKTCFTTLLGYQITRRGHCPLQLEVFSNVKVGSSHLFGLVICRCHRFEPDRSTQATSDPATRKIRRPACPFPLWGIGVSPGMISQEGPFTSHQVNVDANGMNIVGDAANERLSP